MKFVQTAFGALFACGAIVSAFQAARSEPPTFRKDIAPIFAAKCTGCHNPVGAGPFSLIEYESAKRHLDLIKKVTHLRSMPPFKVQSDAGFAPTYAPITDAESIVIQNWLRVGAPEGKGVKPVYKPQPLRWRLGEPDLVVWTPQKITVPAEGAIFSHEFTLPIKFDETKTLSAFDIRPYSPRSARRALLAIESPAESNTFSPLGINTDRLVGAWSIGCPAWKLPDNAGIPIKRGSLLNVKMTYHPSGKPEGAGFYVGLYFAKAPRPLVPKWITLGRKDFEIPGFPEYTTLENSMQLDKDLKIVSIVPEGRYAGLWVNLSANVGASAPHTLLNIMSWDPRWIGAYNFQRPASIGGGVTLTAQIQYVNSNHSGDDELDESRRRPKNPPILYGPADKNELFWVHVQVLEDPKP